MFRHWIPLLFWVGTVLTDTIAATKYAQLPAAMARDSSDHCTGEKGDGRSPWPFGFLNNWIGAFSVRFFLLTLKTPRRSVFGSYTEASMPRALPLGVLSYLALLALLALIERARASFRHRWAKCGLHQGSRAGRFRESRLRRVLPKAPYGVRREALHRSDAAELRCLHTALLADARGPTGPLFGRFIPGFGIVNVSGCFKP